MAAVTAVSLRVSEEALCSTGNAKRSLSIKMMKYIQAEQVINVRQT